MKNKGFTLIELLAVIVILGLILSISTIAVNNIRKKQDAENRRNTISGILTGARRYASDHNTLSNLGVNSQPTTINVKTIVDENYADLDTNEYSDIYGGTVTVTICDDNTKVKYSYVDTVDEEKTTYTDCGCESQPGNSNSVASELCTE